MFSSARAVLRKRSRTVVVAVAATLVTAGGVAYASIPGPDGVIKACYNKPGLLGLGKGELRVIDSQAGCASTETQLSWNQTAPRAIRAPPVRRAIPVLPAPKGRRARPAPPGNRVSRASRARRAPSADT